MRFLKIARPLSAEDEHAVARLNALAHRVRSSFADGPIGQLEPTQMPDVSDPLELRDVLQ